MSTKKKNSVLDEYIKKDKASGEATPQQSRGGSRQNQSHLQLKQTSNNVGGYKRAVEVNVFEEYAPSNFANMTNEELSAIWKHYDRKDAGALELHSKDWLRLSEHAVLRIAQIFKEDYIAQLRLDNKSLGEDTLERRAEAALLKERPYLFPGDGKTHEKNASDMASYMFRNMNVKKDSKVSMQEFMNRWGMFMPKYFQPRASQSSSKSCTLL